MLLFGLGRMSSQRILKLRLTVLRKYWFSPFPEEKLFPLSQKAVLEPQMA